MLIVQKYGGTSVGDAERIRNVARRAISARKEGHDVVVVVSAMAGETNRLLKMTNEIARRPSQREQDVVVSTGEQDGAIPQTRRRMPCSRRVQGPDQIAGSSGRVE